MVQPALLLGPAESPFANPDWSAIGLVLAIVGSFLLANSILFRHPRQLVRERFGKGSQELRTIRDYIFHRVQVNLGFGFLLAGFGLQLYGCYKPLPAGGERTFPALWIGVVVVLAVGLLLGSWWWSLLAFRRYVQEYFVENPPDFEADMALAREVGEIFGMPSHGDDTVQSYVSRLRHHVLANARPGRAPALPSSPDATVEVDETDLEEGLA